MRRSADYQGWSNWDTWHTKLMMDNDRDLYNKSREIVDHGFDSGWSDEEIIKRLRQWATNKIIGPHNREAIKDAQSWNDIPKDERIDPHYEDLKNKSPQAADFVDAIGFGPNVEDTEPMIMRDDLINWEEILQSFKNEREENEAYARDEARKEELTPYDVNYRNDEQVKMMDAWLAHHGVDPHARSYGPGNERERGVWGHEQWVPFDLIKQNVTEYGWPHGFGDATAQQIEQEGGWKYRTRDLGEQAVIALQRGQAVPWQQQMMQTALQGKGYSPEEAQQIMRQRYKLVPNPNYPDQNMLVDMEKPPPQPDPSLDQPGDMTLPGHWGSIHTADEWDEYFDQSNDPYAEDYYEKRRPFMVEFANSVEDPAPKVWIGEPNTFHGDRPRDFDTPGAQHRYYGEIWENTNPPTFKGAPPDRIYDEQALYHAQRAYYNQQNIQKRASDGGDWWSQSQDDWWGTQADSLFNVNVPGDAPGMPHEMITDSLHCPQCHGPMHGLECPSCGFKKEAANHWKDEPRDEHGRWTGSRHPDSLKPIHVDKEGKAHHRVKLLKHTKGGTEVHWVRCPQCGHKTVVADDGHLHTCTNCGNRIGFHDKDALLDSLKYKESKIAAGFNSRGVKLLTNAGFQPRSTQEHAQTYSWIDPSGLEHRIPVSRNKEADRYVAQDLARCHSGTCYCAEQPWNVDPSTPVAPEDSPIRPNSQVEWTQRPGETWTVGEMTGDLAEMYNMQTGEQEIAPVRELQLVAADMVPQDQVKVMPDEPLSDWGEGQWDSDTFLDHNMINEHLKSRAQIQQYKDYAERERRRQNAEWPEMGLREAGWYDEPGRPCPRCDRAETVHGSDLKGQQQEWCPSCGWTDRDQITQQAAPKPGDYAKSRDGHPVQIIRLYTEGENLFAIVRYLDGYQPYPSVGGRAGGTEEDPLWEHRVYDGKVVRPRGDYYNPEDWVVEKGLRLQPQDALPGLGNITAAPNKTDNWKRAGQYYVFAKAGPNKGRWLFVSQDDNHEIWDAMDGKTMGYENRMNRWPVVEWNELPPEALQRIAEQPYIPGRWHEEGGPDQMRLAADNVPGAPVSDSGHWVWLDGHVGMGGIHSDIAESLARDLGYDDTKTNYLSNWIARGHVPEDMAVAVGTLKNNYPYIWNSTRDRNHVWDSVREHVDKNPIPAVTAMRRFAGFFLVAADVDELAEKARQNLFNREDLVNMNRQYLSPEGTPSASGLGQDEQGNLTRPEGLKPDPNPKYNPGLYNDIQRTLERLPSEHYKFYPWVTKQMKKSVTPTLPGGGNVRYPWNTNSHLNDILTQAFRHMEYLRSQPKNSPNAAPVPDINQMDWPGLEKWVYDRNALGIDVRPGTQWEYEPNSNDYDEWANKYHKHPSGGTNPPQTATGPYKWPIQNKKWDVGDGYTVWPVWSENDLKQEGSMMGHCVGGYCNTVQAGNSVIFSLRDAKGEPHVTIELEPRSGGYNIIQIQGKGNTDPDDKYVQKVKQFFQDLMAEGHEVSYTISISDASDLEDYGYTNTPSEAYGVPIEADINTYGIARDLAEQAADGYLSGSYEEGLDKLIDERLVDSRDLGADIKSECEDKLEEKEREYESDWQDMRDRLEEQYEDAKKEHAYARAEEEYNNMDPDDEDAEEPDPDDYEDEFPSFIDWLAEHDGEAWEKEYYGTDFRQQAEDDLPEVVDLMYRYGAVQNGVEEWVSKQSMGGL